MADPTLTSDAAIGEEPKAHFAKAIEEAKAGAQALGKQAQERAEGYRDKFTQTGSDLASQALDKSEDVRERAFVFASEGKTKATGAIASLGKLVEDNAALVDEKAGAKYGDYVRQAGRSLQDTADRLDAKDVAELAEEARVFVRANPGLAVGIAAVGGFFLARLFKGSDS